MARSSSPPARFCLRSLCLIVFTLLAAAASLAQAQSITFTVTRVPASCGSVSCDVLIEAGENYVGVAVTASQPLPGAALFNLQVLPVSSGATTSDFRVAQSAIIMAKDETQVAANFVVETNDGPELDETFVFTATVSQYFGAGVLLPASGQSSFAVVILANEEPYGRIGIVSASTPLRVSEGDDVNFLLLQRVGGRFGQQQVEWTVTPSGEGINITADRVIILDENVAQVVVPFAIIDDDVPELLETYVFELTNVTGGADLVAGSTSRQILIEPSDDPYGLFRFNASSVTVDESAGNVVLDIVRERGALGAVDVYFSTQDDTTVPNGAARSAVAGTDYTSISQQRVGFDIDETHQTVFVGIIDNSEAEPTKGFIVNMSVVDPLASLGSPDKAIVIIAASDMASGRFSFAAGSLSRNVNEPEAPQTQLNVDLTVQRTAGTFGAVTIKFELSSVDSSGNPKPLTDAAPTSGVVNFAEGQTSATVTAIILADDVPEMEDIIYVDLVGTIGGYAGQSEIGSSGRATITIAPNDDPYGIYSLDSPSTPLVASETDTGTMREVLVPVVRSRGLFESVTVSWMLTTQTNTTGVTAADDFLAVSGTVTFAAGQTTANIVLHLLDDNEPELVEHFTITLTGTDRGSSLLSPTASDLSRTIVVPFSDSPFGVFSITAAVTTFAEPDDTFTPATVTISRAAPLVGRVLVDYTAQSGPTDASTGAATNTMDFAVETKTLIFEPGDSSKTFSVFILSDDIPERDERFTLSISRLRTSDSNYDGAATADSNQGSISFVIEANDEASGVLALSVSNRGTLAVTEPPSNDYSDETALIVEVTRLRGAFGNIQVSWQLTGSDTTSQFLHSSGILTLFDGVTSTDFAIQPLHDNVPELNQTYTLALTAVTGGIPGQAHLASELEERSATVVIVENDDARGVFRFSDTTPLTPTLLEPPAGASPTVHTFTIVREAGTHTQVTVFWTLTLLDGCNLPSDPPATDCGPTGDFLAVSGSTVFAESQTSATFSIGVVPDDVPELTERFQLSLSLLPGQGRLGTANQAVVSVPENDNPYGVLAFQATGTGIGGADTYITRVNEPANGTTSVSLAFERSAGAFGIVTLHWELRSAGASGATLDEDVGPMNGSVTLASGQRTAAVVLTVYADDLPEFDESVLVVLTGATATGHQPASIAVVGAVATLTIAYNGDPHGRVSFATAASPAFDESSGRVDLLVVRTGGLLGTIRVPWATVDGTAKAVSGDFVPVDNDELTFAEGQSEANITVEILDDSVPELDETFSVVLGAPYLVGPVTGAQPRLTSPAEMIVTIAENDDARGVLAFTSTGTRVSESNQQVLVTVERTAGAFGTVTVAYAIVDETATAGQDYTVVGGQLTGVLTFGPNQRTQTLVLSVLDDTIPEVEESAIVQLSNVTGGARLGSPTEFRLTIDENDDARGVLGFDVESRSEVLQTFDVDVGTVQLKVTRTGGAFGAVSVDFVVQVVVGNDTLTGNITDVQPTTGTVQFADGARTGTLTLQIVDEGLPELEESILVVLQAPHGGARLRSGEGTAVITIRSNNDPLGVVDMGLDGTRGVLDGSGHRQLLFGIVRTRGTMEAINVTGRLEYTPNLGATACSGTGLFALAPTTRELTLAVGQTQADVVFDVPDSFGLTPTSAFCFHLVQVERESGGVMDTSTGPSPRLGSNSTQIYLPSQQLLPGIVRLRSATVLQAEESSNASLAVAQLVFVREQGVFSDISFGLSIRSDLSSATAGFAEDSPVGVDVIVGEKIVTLAQDATEATVELMVVDDAEPELEEVLAVQVGSGLLSGYGTLAAANTVVQLEIAKSDDPHGVVEFASTHVQSQRAENSVDIVVQRSPGLFGDIVVHWTYVNGTAVEGLDFEAPSDGSVRLVEGQTTATFNITLLIVDTSDPVESFRVQLTDVTGGARLGDTTTMQVDITSCFHCKVGAGVTGVVGYEPAEGSGQATNTVLVPVVRSPDTFDSIVVFWRLAGGSPAADFAEIEGNISLASGQSTGVIELHILDDDAPELDEAYTLFLVAVDGETSVDTAARLVTVTIKANDYPFGRLRFAASSLTTMPEPTDTTTPQWYTVTVERSPNSGTVGDVAVKVQTQHILLSSAFAAADTSRSASGAGEICQQQVENTVDACALACVSNFAPCCVAGFTYNTATGNCALLNATAGGPTGGAEANTAYYAFRTDVDGRHVAVPGLDYEDTELEVTIPHGSWQGSGAVVAVLPDDDDEADEYFKLVLTSVRIIDRDPSLPLTELLGVVSGPGHTSAVTIPANGLGGGTVAFNGTSFAALESDGVGRLSLVRGGPAYGGVTVTWQAEQLLDAATGNTTAADADLQATSGTVTLVDLQRSAVLEVPLVDDDVPELSETFRITLVDIVSHSGLGVALDAPTVADLVVAPNDFAFGVVRLLRPVPAGSELALQEPNTQAGEGDDGDGGGALPSSAQLTFERLYGQFQVTEVGWALEPEALALSTFGQANGTVKFEALGSDAPASLQHSVVLSVLDDAVPELSQEFNLTWWVVAGDALLTDAEAPLQIRVVASDYPYGLFSIDSPTSAILSEGFGPNVTVVVRRSFGNLGSSVAVACVAEADASGSGSAGDVLFDPAVLVFDAATDSLEVTLMAVNDIEVEPMETLNVVLQRVSNQGAVSADHVAVTIRPSDDGQQFGIFAPLADQTVEEDDEDNQLVILRDGGTEGEVVLMYAITALSFVNFFEVPLADAHFSAVTTDIQVGKTVEECAEICVLRGSSCVAFDYTSASGGICTFRDDIDAGQPAPGVSSSIYIRRIVKSSLRRAEAGADFVAVAAAQVVFATGETHKLVNVSVLADGVPELPEVFGIQVLAADSALAQAGTPGAEIGEPQPTVVTIAGSDSINGKFSFRMDSNHTEVQVVPEGTTSPVFTIERSMGSHGRVSVSWIVVPQGGGGSGNGSTTSAASADWSPATGTVTFEHGITELSIPVLLARSDGEPELDEEFELQLGEPVLLAGFEEEDDDDHDISLTSVSLGNLTTVDLIVPENDDAAGIFAFDEATRTAVLILEEGGTVTLTVTRTGGALKDVSLWWTTTEVAPGLEVQLSPLSGQLDFAIGQREATVTLVYDDDAEPAEASTFIVALLPNATGNAEVQSGTDSVSVTLEGNDDRFAIEDADVTITLDEDNEDAPSQHTLSICRLQSNVQREVELHWHLDGIAEAVAQFETQNGSVVFDSSSVSCASVTLVLIDDAEPELDGGLEVVLQSFSSLVHIETNSSRLMLQFYSSDDAQGVFGFSQAWYVTSESAATVPGLEVVRSGGRLTDVEVVVRTATGSASAPHLAMADFDYIAVTVPPLVLTFAAGLVGPDSNSVTVHLIEDEIPELDELFDVEIVSVTSNATGAGTGLLRSPRLVLDTATVTIAENDDARGVFEFALNSMVLTERDTSTHTVTITRAVGGTYGNISVIFEAEPISAGLLAPNGRDSIIRKTLQSLPTSAAHRWACVHIGSTALLVYASGIGSTAVYRVQPNSQQLQLVQVLSTNDVRDVVAVQHNNSDAYLVFAVREDASNPSALTTQAHIYKYNTVSNRFVQFASFAVHRAVAVAAVRVVVGGEAYLHVAVVNTASISLATAPNVQLVGVRLSDAQVTLLQTVDVAVLPSAVTFAAVDVLPSGAPASADNPMLIVASDTLGQTTTFYQWDAAQSQYDQLQLGNFTSADHIAGVARWAPFVYEGELWLAAARPADTHSQVLRWAPTVASGSAPNLLPVYDLSLAGVTDVAAVENYGDATRLVAVTSSGATQLFRIDRDTEGLQLQLSWLVQGGRNLMARAIRGLTANEPSDGLLYVMVGTVANGASSLFSVVRPADAGADVVVEGVTSLLGGNGTERLYGEVTILEGSRQGVLQLHTLDDNLPEGTEELRVTLTNTSTGARLGAAVDLLVQVLPNDQRLGRLGFADETLQGTNRYHEPETGSLDILLKVVRRGLHDQAVTLNWKATGLRVATLESTQGTVTLAAGETSGTVTLRLLADDVPALSEEFEVTLSVPLAVGTAASLIPGATKVTITLEGNDDPFGGLGWAASSLQVTATEGNALELTVQRAPDAFDSVDLDWAIVGISSGAQPFADWQQTSGTLTIGGNGVEQTATVTLMPVADNVPELEETFVVVLSLRGTPPLPRLLPQATNCTITLAASDTPYGRLETSGGLTVQTSIVPLRRSLQVNIVRTFGTFGQLQAGVELTHAAAGSSVFVSADSLLTSPPAATVQFEAGQSLVQLSFELSTAAHIGVNEQFRLRLINGFLSGSDVPEPQFYTDAELEVDVSLPSSVADGALQVTTASQTATVPEPDAASGATTVQVTIERVGGVFGSLPVVWSLRRQGSSAPASTDVLPIDGNLVLAHGETTTTITYTVLPDDVPEIDERFRLQLQLADDYAGGSRLASPAATAAAHNLVVPANDNPLGKVLLSQLTFTSTAIAGYNRALEVTLLRQPAGGTFGQLQVMLRLAYNENGTNPFVVGGGGGSTNSTADDDDDVEPIFDVILNTTVGAGMASAKVTVNLSPSLQLHVGGLFAARLLAVQLLTPMEQLSTTVTLVPQLSDTREQAASVDHDVNTFGRIQFASVADVTVAEDVGVAQLRLLRDVASVGELHVSWKINDGTATAASGDFEPADGVGGTGTGLVVFADGQTEAFLDIVIVNDGVPEPTETFSVVLLSVGGGGVLASASVVNVHIAPNDVASGRFAIAAGSRLQTVAEPAVGTTAEVRITVQRTAGLFGAVQVAWSVTAAAPGSATGQLQPLSGVVNFADGQSSRDIVLEILPDSLPELDLIVNITLASLSGGLPLQTELAANEQLATVIIAANGVPYGRLQLSSPDGDGVGEVSAAAPEGRLVDVVVARAAGTGTFGTLSISLDVSGIAAVSGGGSPVACTVPATQDCVRTVTLAAGVTSMTVRIRIADSVTLQTTNTIVVSLSQAVVVAGGSSTAGNMPEVDSSAVDVTYTVPLAMADGELRFTQSTAIMDEDSPALRQLTLTVERRFGGYTPSSIGVLQILWQATGNGAANLLVSSGALYLSQGQQQASLQLSVKDDNVPALSSSFVVSLFNFTGCTHLTTGGGGGSGETTCASPGPAGVHLTTGASGRTVTVTVAASDDPHGVLQFGSNSTNVLVAGGATTARLRVDRSAGAFGIVRVNFRALQAQYDTLAIDYQATLTFAEGQNTAEAVVPLTINNADTSTTTLRNFTVLLFADQADLQGARLSGRVLASVTLAPPTSTVTDNTAGVGGSTGGKSGDKCVLLLPTPCLGLSNAQQTATASVDTVLDCLDRISTALSAGNQLCSSSLSFVQDVLLTLLASGDAAKSSDQIYTIGGIINDLVGQTAGASQLETLLAAHAEALLADCDPTIDGSVSCSCCCVREVAYSNFKVEVHRGHSSQVQDLTVDATPISSLTFPPDLQSLASLHGLNDTTCVTVRVSAVQPASLVFPPNDDDHGLVGGVVLEAGLSEFEVTTLGSGNELYYVVVDTGHEVLFPRCVFWDADERLWSDEGCELVSYVDRAITCRCSHLTTFGVEETLPAHVPYHVYGGVAALIAAVVVLLVLVCISMGEHIRDSGARIHMLVAVLLLSVALVISMALARDDGSSGKALFASGLVLHYFVLVAMAAITAVMVRFFMLGGLQVADNNDGSYMRFGLAMVWVLPAFVVALYVAVAFDSSSLDRDEIYGDVSDNRRVAFVKQEGALIGAYFVELFALAAAAVIIGMLHWRRHAMLRDQQFTVSEADILLMVEAKHMQLVCASLWVVLLVGTDTMYSTSSNLEILLTTLLCVVSALLLFNAYRLYRTRRQIADGSWDPWAAVHGSNSKPPSRASTSANGSMLPGASPRSGVVQKRATYDMPLNDLGRGNVGYYDAYNEPSYLDVSSVKGYTASHSPGSANLSRPAPQKFLNNHLLLGSITEPGEASEFDDLIYALKSGGIGAGGSVGDGPMDDGLGYDAQDSNTDGVDLRRMTIADTHL